MSKMRVGFIGVGLMGHGMAKNILAKGYPLTILANRNRVPVEALIAQGAKEGKSPADIARASDIVFLCVTDSPTVEGIIRGPDGLMAGAHKGMVVVDCSTANPVSTMAIAADLARLGVDFVDAPLGGTPSNAEIGQLTAMVGADSAVFARVEPVIACWAAKIVHLGPVGTGHKMKLINNFIAMGYGALFSEALALAQKVGISSETVDKVIRGGRMDSGFYQTFMSYVVDGNRNAHQFTLNNAFKDMRYVDAMANEARIANPISNAVKNSFAGAIAAGKGEDYVPMLADHVALANGFERKKKS